MSHSSRLFTHRQGHFVAAAALAAGTLVISGSTASAQCCCGGASAFPLLQTQALQAQFLQAQVLQAQLTQAALLTAARSAQPNQPLPGLPQGQTRQLTAKLLNRDPAVADDALAAGLAKDLVQGTGARRLAALGGLQENEGDAFTRALAGAIPKLSGDPREQARAALARRLSRAPTSALKDHLQGQDVELGRAAALAGALTQDRELVPDLIAALERKPDGPLVPAVRAALRSLSARDYGPAQYATTSQRAKAVSAWKEWWKQSGTP